MTNSECSGSTQLNLRLIGDLLNLIRRQLDIDIPAETRANGTMFLHIVLVNDHGPFEWRHLKREGITVVQRIALTEYTMPRAATFNLLGSNDVSNGFRKSISFTKMIRILMEYF